ncbi:MAG TPA: ribosome maturation factor RimM [Terracidiphilus sp.]|nr:ribosome maturation factor RimM [Terracidiphilus sp.]
MPVPPGNWVWLARIRRPQGRKGEVLAEILTDFPDKFAERRQLWLLPAASVSVSVSVSVSAPGPSHLGTGETKPMDSPARPVELTNHWLHKGGIVLHFAGVDSISAAEELKGMIVAVPQTERAPLAADEVFVGDLIGCVLVDVAGAEAATVGEIENVDRAGGAAPLLVVRGACGEVLIPFARSYLRRVDLEGKRVEMALPEGLVDLNAPGA